MTDVFLERSFDEPLSLDIVKTLLVDAENCLGLYRVRWRESLFAKNRRQMLCRFDAPDAESARIALRQAGADVRRLWSGTVHEAPALGPADQAGANVLVERAFQEPVTIEEIQALEDAGSACLQNHRVRFIRTFFSLDRRRMLCLYQAPDAESVRVAQRQAAMPLERVWSFRLIRADD
ncbi:MAG: DUF4242 domain-containing protein [Aquisalimonadaceae bacterium]